MSRLRAIRRDHDAAVVLCLVCEVTRYAPGILLLNRRGTASISFARHLLMYMLHVALGRSCSEVAATLGCERSTVAYGCAAIEDRRDSPEFDESLIGLEQAIRRKLSLDMEAILARH